MSTEMTTEELSAFYDNLSRLVAEGDEDEAQEYLEHHIQRLPEELKNEILGTMFLKALVDEAKETETIARIQEEGMTAIKALEVLKKELEIEEKGENP
ncbi:hypothetical protein A2704_00500 [Candidatus Kaiserbacteria bacterium RIFCSPHIGHO2_01_FULL_54_36b]|uniref:Uncharacterized protein n=1 Tax=Candidatus Kaiserbacteria bacterium RIFCSPHIGHO2_01_FULL_54_36b TaxID=1798483 RepID=A0A1F6CHF9_9BACT|nr:MAG: hypothetical protein A2704_00500 [Candidatus Kaiserbacteria bacterium RIFCSPHIGHO2_01_FULL_54_36b]